MTNAATDPMRGSLVELGEVSIWADSIGRAGAHAVVLLAGADSPGFRWTPALVDRLVGEDLRVVRFDHRDCGRSTLLGPDAAYTLDDLASDTLALMDHFGISAAHMIGRSMGGMIAQEIALANPDRVTSLTLIGTSPGAGDERLPGPADTFVDAMMQRLFEGPPAENREREQWIIDQYRLLSGPLYSFDEEAQRALATAELKTGWAPETGHGVAVHSSESRLDRVGGITAPTLVVHGTSDPVFAPEHARELAERIPGSVLVEVEGLGHEVPDGLLADLWPVLSLHLRESSDWPRTDSGGD